MVEVVAFDYIYLYSWCLDAKSSKEPKDPVIDSNCPLSWYIFYKSVINVLSKAPYCSVYVSIALQSRKTLAESRRTVAGLKF